MYQQYWGCIGHTTDDLKGADVDLYAELGVRKAINAWGHITVRGGSRLPPEVTRAMVEASQHFVDVHEFKAAVSRRIAELTHNEACEPCCGAAAGLILSTAACIASTDPAAMAQLPNLEGLKDEVVVFRAQANPYWSVIQRVGVRLREVGTIRGTESWQLEKAMGPQTAAVIFFTADYYNRGGAPSLERTIEVAHRASVPVIVDAASQLPPKENLWRFTQMGADLVIFSGGKALSAPNPTGLIFGRPDLVHACSFANTPNHTIGRPMKLGKEELAGLLAAVKWFLNLDHEARYQRWERQASYIIRELSGIAGVRTEHSSVGESGVPGPRVLVRIEPTVLGRKMSEVLASLRSGDPWIAVGPSDEIDGSCLDDTSTGFYVNPQTLEEGEEQIVALRLREAFGASGAATIGRTV